MRCAPLLLPQQHVKLTVELLVVEGFLRRWLQTFTEALWLYLLYASLAETKKTETGEVARGEEKQRGENPVKSTDPTGLREIEGAQLYGDEFYDRDTNSLRSPTDLNLQFAEKIREYVGVEYGSGTTTTKADCSGVGIGSLRAMGADVDRLTANGMANSNFVGKFKDVNTNRQGDAGVLNFYSYEKPNDHVNYGVGQIGDEVTKQIVDASAPGTTWEAIHNKDPRQTAPNAESGVVNKTYTPFSGNRNPASQGYIIWQELF